MLLDTFLAFLADRLGESRLTVRESVGGAHNRNFIIDGSRAYLLRCFSDDDLERINREYGVLALLDGWHAPQVYFKDLTRQRLDRFYFVCEYLAHDRVDAVDDALLSQAAEILRRLHRETASRPHRIEAVTQWARARLQGADRRVRSLRDRVEGSLLSHEREFIAPSHYSFIHGDPTIGNMIWTDRGLVLVDWEFTRPGHILEDLSAFIVENRITGEQERSFLAAYGYAETPRNRELLETFKTRRLLEALAWSVENAPDVAEAAGRLRERLAP